MLEPWLLDGDCGRSALLHYAMVLGQWNTGNPEMFHFYQVMHNSNVPDSFISIESSLGIAEMNSCI